MAKLSAPVREVARLLDLVPYLDTHPHVSIRDLAEEFETTESEMQKSLVTLSLCGYTPYDLIDVHYETGFVTISQHDELNMARALTAEETISLTLGLELLLDSIPSDRADLLSARQSLLSKLKSLVGDVVHHSTSGISETERAIASAISSRSVLEISYTSALTEASDIRTIEPLNLYVDSGRIYCEAYCHKASDFRTFRVDRMVIRDVTKNEPSRDSFLSRLSKRIRRDRDFSAVVAIHQSMRFNAELLNISRLDRKSRGVVQAFSPEWVGRAILSTGGEVEVVDDLALRGHISTKANEILALYKD
jgi:predicted DNA-binding transcriptional regulator YafY